jgi:hypothetical protein
MSLVLLSSTASASKLLELIPAVVLGTGPSLFYAQTEKVVKSVNRVFDQLRPLSSVYTSLFSPIKKVAFLAQ